MTAEERAREVLERYSTLYAAEPHPATIITAGTALAAMLTFAAETREEAAKRLERRAGEWRSSMIGRTVQQCQVPLHMIDELHEQAAAIRRGEGGGNG